MKILLWFCVLLFAGCASQIMSKYIGQDIRKVAINYGPPTNSFDLGDGRRVFQWISTTNLTIPGTVQTTGTVTAIGNTEWLNSNSTITSPPSLIQMDVCTYIAIWDEAQNAWIVSEVRIPRGLVASCF